MSGGGNGGAGAAGGKNTTSSFLSSSSPSSNPPPCRRHRPPQQGRGSGRTAREGSRLPGMVAPVEGRRGRRWVRGRGAAAGDGGAGGGRQGRKARQLQGGNVVLAVLVADTRRTHGCRRWRWHWACAGAVWVDARRGLARTRTSPPRGVLGSARRDEHGQVEVLHEGEDGRAVGAPEEDRGDPGGVRPRGPGAARHGRTSRAWPTCDRTSPRPHRRDRRRAPGTAGTPPARAGGAPGSRVCSASRTAHPRRRAGDGIAWSHTSGGRPPVSCRRQQLWAGVTRHARKHVAYQNGYFFLRRGTGARAGWYSRKTGTRRCPVSAWNAAYFSATKASASRKRAGRRRNASGMDSRTSVVGTARRGATRSTRQYFVRRGGEGRGRPLAVVRRSVEVAARSLLGVARRALREVARHRPGRIEHRPRGPPRHGVLRDLAARDAVAVQLARRVGPRAEVAGADRGQEVR